MGLLSVETRSTGTGWPGQLFLLCPFPLVDGVTGGGLPRTGWHLNFLNSLPSAGGDPFVLLPVSCLSSLRRLQMSLPCKDVQKTRWDAYPLPEERLTSEDAACPVCDHPYQEKHRGLCLLAAQPKSWRGRVWGDEMRFPLTHAHPASFETGEDQLGTIFLQTVIFLVTKS